MTIDDVMDLDLLYDAMCKCRKNVSWKPSVQSFLLNDIDRLEQLSNDLKNGTYEEKPQRKFKIYEPKERNITSLAFVDRIYQRSLADNLVYPQMVKSLIYDNVACQHNKGDDFGCRRLKTHLHKYYRKYGREGYVLQLDVKGYYPNMSHAKVEEKFRKHLDDVTFAKTKEILDKFDGDYGYHAGSQMIQIAGICLLDEADHFAKEQLHIKHYLRYMDDTIILCPSKELAQQWLSAIEKEYAKVECTLNQKKTRIYPIKSGIDFLGFHFSLTDTGKVLQVADHKKLRIKKNKYRKMLYRVYFEVEGKKPVTNKKFDECITAYLANLSKGNSYNIVNDFNNYINEREQQYVQEFNTKRRENA